MPERATIEIDRRLGPDEPPDGRLRRAHSTTSRSMPTSAAAESSTIRRSWRAAGLSDQHNRPLAERLAQLVQKHGRASEVVGVPYGTDAAASRPPACRRSSSAPARSLKPTRPTNSSRSTSCSSRRKSFYRHRVATGLAQRRCLAAARSSELHRPCEPSTFTNNETAAPAASRRRGSLGLILRSRVDECPPRR